MRPGEQARGEQHDGEHADNRQRGAAKFATRGLQHHEQSRTRRRAGQQRDADEAPGLVGEPKQELGKPLVGDPGLVGEAEGKRVDVGDRAMRRHPRAGGDVGEGVAVIEDRRRKRADRECRQRQRVRREIV